MDERPAETGERLPNERVILGGATVLLSALPIGLLVAPSPLAALVLRHGLASGIWTAVISGAAASFLTQSPLILAQVLLALALGIALGQALRESLGLRRTLVSGSLVVFVTTVLLMVIFERVTGMSVIDVVATFWQEALGSVAGSDSVAGQELLEVQIAAMRATLPSSLLMGSIALTVLDFGLTRWLVQKLPGGKDTVPALPPFARWRFPRWVAGVFVLGRITEIAGGTRLGGALALALINVTLALGLLVAIQGFAVGWHFLGRLRVPKALRLAAAAAFYLFLQPIAALLFLVTGLLDAWLDLRRLRRVEGAGIRGA